MPGDARYRKLPWLARLYLWATYRLYDEFAWAYDAVSWGVSLGRWDAWRRLALDYVRGPRVLELGFGTGELLLALARNPALAVWGLDLSRAMHRITARKLRRQGLAAPRTRAYAQALPFAVSAFDTVVATFPAGYAVAPETLREVARVLRPGGRLVIVGLFVESDRLPWRLFAWLTSGPHPPALEDVAARFSALAAEAGLTLAVEVRASDHFRLPVFILERAGAA